jgi:hypothetical protein
VPPHVVVVVGLQILVPEVTGIATPNKRTSNSHKSAQWNPGPEPDHHDTLQVAESLGFLYAASGPMVRSSYRAGEFYLTNVLRGKQQQQKVSEQQPGHSLAAAEEQLSQGHEGARAAAVGAA